jgi:hypothetical protein
MAIVIHKVYTNKDHTKWLFYAYEHKRINDKVVSKYLGKLTAQHDLNYWLNLTGSHKRKDKLSPEERKELVKEELDSAKYYESIGYPNIALDEKRHAFILQGKTPTYQNMELLAKRLPSGEIWVNPDIPIRIGIIEVRERVKEYENEYWKLKNAGIPDARARLCAIEKQYRGLNKNQVLRIGAILDSVCDKVNRNKKPVPTKKGGDNPKKSESEDRLPIYKSFPK